MAGIIIAPAQAVGIGLASAMLHKQIKDDDDQIHVTECSEGSGEVRVETGDSDVRYWVAEDGTVRETSPFHRMKEEERRNARR